MQGDIGESFKKLRDNLVSKLEAYYLDKVANSGIFAKGSMEEPSTGKCSAEVIGELLEEYRKDFYGGVGVAVEYDYGIEEKLEAAGLYKDSTKRKDGFAKALDVFLAICALLQGRKTLKLVQKSSRVLWKNAMVSFIKISSV